MTTRIKLRRDTAANWTENDPVLALGEAGYDTTNNELRVGDGTSVWSELSAIGGGGIEIGAGGEIQIGEVTGDVSQWNVNSIAIGTDAGVDQSTAAIAIGHGAGNSGQLRSTIAIGRSAGEIDQDWNGIAIGRYAGADTQGTEAIAIGKNSGNYQQSQHAIAIGMDAGNDNQGVAAIAIGEEAGEQNQSFRAVALGRWAGYEDQGQQAVAIGARTGYYDQGQYAVAIGRHAGEVGQGDYSIAIGQEAAQGRTPINADGYIERSWVSGGTTGTDYMTLNSVTGVYVGMAIQGTGITNTVITSVNTGTNSIEFTPVTTDAASGTYSFYGSQGQYAIAIGAYAGKSIQHNNSVIINASGEEVNSPAPGTVVIKTVRAVQSNAGFYPCYYNPETGELVYFVAP
jgi:hypothetical protein